MLCPDGGKAEIEISQLDRDKPWEEPTPDLGGWGPSVRVRYACDNASKHSHSSRRGQWRTPERRLGGLTGTERVTPQGGSLQPAAATTPDS